MKSETPPPEKKKNKTRNASATYSTVTFHKRSIFYFKILCYKLNEILNVLIQTLRNIYATQQDTKSFLMRVSLFSTYVSSTCFRPHRSTIRSVLYKLYSQIWYVVILCVLLDTSSRYFVTAGRVV